MENSTKTQGINSANANNPTFYVSLVLGVFITVLGALLRFFTEWNFIDVVSNIILVVGVIICLKAIVNILK